MSTNMELITSVTVGSGGAASVTLPASGTIPQTYTDLKVVISARTNRSNAVDAIGIYFNNDTTSARYSARQLTGTGSSRQSTANNPFNDENMYVSGNTATASTFGNSEIYIPNYAGSNQKSFSVDSVSENNATTAYANIGAGLYDQTTAITTITFVPISGTSIQEGSTFYLYGISKVTSTPKATGGIISQDNTHWYHTFPFTSTFTPTEALTADILCIAGGGGVYTQDMTTNNGGGGAGGFRLLTSQSLTTTGYTCTVGGGGAGGASNNASGIKGSNSSISGSGFTTITATGGGNTTINTGATGGSGGGGSTLDSSNGGAGNEGGYTPVEGFAGGQGKQDNNYPAGGGGGAGGAGGTPASNTSNGGAGGIGSSAASSWGLVTGTGQNVAGVVYYAGGGGGGAVANAGTGGSGGGGNGSSDRSVNNGVANTGGGGGGTGGSPGQKNGAAGGSGLVIVRYAK